MGMQRDKMLGKEALVMQQQESKMQMRWEFWTSEAFMSGGFMLMHASLLISQPLRS
jgi:hypothetical protein